jgi:hypothetical protein
MLVQEAPARDDGRPHDSFRGAQWTALLVGLVTSALAFRLYLLVDRFAVALVFWDQWDFLDGLFRGAGPWELFLRQHGPHRQGVGALLYAVLYPATQWNSRAEGFTALGCVGLACLVALSVKVRLAGRMHLTDTFLPLAFFSISSWELFTGAQNLSNGPVPILLVSLAAAAALHPSPWPRSVFLSLLGALGLFTGFALFLVPSIGLWLFVETVRPSDVQGERPAAIAGILFLLASMALFAHGYRNQPAVDCFAFPYRPLSGYGEFLAGLSGRAWGIFYPSPRRALLLREIASLGLLFAMAAVALDTLADRFRSPRQAPSPLRRCLFLLCSFSALFAVFTAIGRVCLGPAASFASRYTIYSVPGMLGLYLAALLLPRRARAGTVLAAALLLVLVVKERGWALDWDVAGWAGNKKADWARCYRETRDVGECDARTGFPVYPEASRDLAQVPEKLRFLEASGLSLFATPPPAR